MINRILKDLTCLTSLAKYDSVQRIMLFEELLEDLKKHRNDMVARNYPFQQLSNLILKYEDKAKEVKDTPQEKWIEGYNKWRKEQNK